MEDNDRWNETHLADSGALPFEQKLVRVMLVLVAASLAAAIIVSGIELLSLSWTRSQAPPEGASAAKVAWKPRLHPLELLPAEINGAAAVMRQPMPGAGDYAAEALYAPGGDPAAGGNPLTVYAGITWYPGRGLAAAAIRQRAADYKAKKKLFAGHRALAGLSADRAGYFIGWTAGNYSIEVDAVFARKGAGDSRRMIELSNLIADQIRLKADGLIKGTP